MRMGANWLDVENIPTENGARAEELPSEASIGRPYGKSRFILDAVNDAG